MEATAVKYKGQGLKVIKSSVEIPEFNLCKGNSLKDSDAETIKAALLKLDGQNPETKTVLGVVDSSYTGFVEAVDEDYEVVRTMLDKVERR